MRPLCEETISTLSSELSLHFEMVVMLDKWIVPLHK